MNDVCFKQAVDIKSTSTENLPVRRVERHGDGKSASSSHGDPRKGVKNGHFYKPYYYKSFQTFFDPF